MEILIVDDDEVFLDRMKRVLTLDNHFITTTTSGDKALFILDTNKFDLILTDLKMPGLSGLEFIKIMKDKEINSIIIMITGYGTIESAVNAMKAGAYDYILKPFDIDAITMKIKEVETEIQLRKEILSHNNDIKSPNLDLDELNSLDEYKKPFLIISNENSNPLVKKFKLSNYSLILLSYDEKVDSIPPTKLNILKSKIEEFVDQNEDGTVLFKGIEEILKVHDWETIKNFLKYISSKIMDSKFPLLIFIDDNTRAYNNQFFTILNDSLSLLMGTSFINVIKLLSHPLRRKIIKIIRNETKVSFNKILKKLHIKKSSLLAFHLNKLNEENTFDKIDNYYSLSMRGQYFSNIIPIFENLGFTDPFSQVKIYKI